MTRTKKTNLKIIGATTICIFSLASMFTGTLAWFASNKAVTATGMTIRVALDDTDVQALTVHRCILSESTNTLLKFDSTPSVTVTGHGSIETGSGIEMNNYSTLNQTQPVLLLFYFNEGILESDVNITATADSSQFYGSASQYNNDANYIKAFPFSSAISFKVATYTSQSFPFNNVQVSDLSSASSFVSFTKNNEGSIISSSFADTINLFAGSSSNEIKFIAVILDYYPEAIDYIVKHTSASAFLSNENCIDFICDWALKL